MLLDFSKEKLNLKNLFKKYLENWQLSILIFLQEWYNENPKLLIQSSGTTNFSKFFYVKKKYMIHSACMTGKFFNLGIGSRVLLCLPINFIAAKMLLIRSIVLRWSLYCIPPLSNPLKMIDQTFDFVPMVPLQVFNSLVDLVKVKILLIGGAPISRFLEKSLQNVHSFCYASYGMTETLGHIALKRINGIKSNKYFKPLPGIYLSINKNNCLKIFAPKLMETSLQTKDLVKLYPKGKFIWLGRYDNLINSGGVKIIVEQLEKKLEPFIHQPFFIAGLYNKLLGQSVTLFIEGDPFIIKIPDNLFIGYNKFYKPREFYFIPYFSWTFSKKIQREKTLKNFLKSQNF